MKKAYKKTWTGKKELYSLQTICMKDKLYFFVKIDKKDVKKIIILYKLHNEC